MLFKKVPEGTIWAEVPLNFIIELIELASIWAPFVNFMESFIVN